MGFEILGEVVKLLGGYGKPADSTKKGMGVRFFAMFERLLNGGKLVPNLSQMVEGGLGGVVGGLQLLKSDSFSGKKLSALLSNNRHVKGRSSGSIL